MTVPALLRWSETVEAKTRQDPKSGGGTGPGYTWTQDAAEVGISFQVGRSGKEEQAGAGKVERAGSLGLWFATASSIFLLLPCCFGHTYVFAGACRDGQEGRDHLIATRAPEDRSGQGGRSASLDFDRWPDLGQGFVFGKRIVLGARKGGGEQGAKPAKDTS